MDLPLAVAKPPVAKSRAASQNALTHIRTSTHVSWREQVGMAKTDAASDAICQLRQASMNVVRRVLRIVTRVPRKVVTVTAQEVVDRK
jgi:hypothetical protein